MAQARGGSFFFAKRSRSGKLLAAVLTILTAPAFAQDAGVSGIPPGPANINGLNNAGRDPSGIGNAAKIAPLPPPSTALITPPAATPLYSTRPYPSSAPVRVAVPRWSRLSPRARRIAEEARVKENDRLLKHGVPSICRGC